MSIQQIIAVVAAYRATNTHCHPRHVNARPKTAEEGDRGEEEEEAGEGDGDGDGEQGAASIERIGRANLSLNSICSICPISCYSCLRYLDSRSLVVCLSLEQRNILLRRPIEKLE